MTTAKERYPELFSPFKIGGKELANRLTMAPLYVAYGTEDGKVSPHCLDHYREMGASGLGLVVVESTSMHHKAIGSLKTLRIYEDSFIEEMSKLADVIHQGGAVASCQINHPGSFSMLGEPVSASTVPVFGFPPRELSVEDIQEIVQSYAASALRVKKAGFDMVELHGGTGYLLVQFLSPRTNKRTDDYGGSLENRMRFPLEVLAATREAVGQDFPVGYRFLADEWMPEGFTFPESEQFARALEKGGAAYLSVMGGTYEAFALPDVQERMAQEGFMVDLAEKIGKVVSIPIITAGRINTPELGEKILKEKKADLIGLARMIWIDPDWVRKAGEGRGAEIIQCKKCDSCMQQVMQGQSLICASWSKEKRLAVKRKFGIEDTEE